MAAAERCLQIIAAGITVDIHNLACKVQALDALGFHGLGVNLLHAHAACGNDSLCNRTCCGNGDDKMLQRLQQSVTLLARNLVDEFVFINVGHIQHNGNQSLRQQILHAVEHLLTAVLHKIALNARI